MSIKLKTFIEPEGIIRKTVCRVSGKLATAACGANVYSEVFTEGLAPATACEGHGQIRVCNDSKQMATSQCPNVLDTMGYIPEKERGAVWVTENVLTTEITGSCPLHPEPAAPAPAPAPAPTPAPSTDKKDEDTKPSGGNSKPSGGTQKPSEESQKPSGGESQKPSGGESQKPSGGESQNPGGGESQNPSGGETQKPSGGESQNPGGGDTQQPGSDESSQAG